MSATFVNVTRQQMEECLVGFQPMNLPRTEELVYGKRFSKHNQQFSVRVYTGINPNGNSRECGKDAIRVEIYVRTSAGEVRRVGGSKRVNRVSDWHTRLQERIANWQDALGPKCPCCHAPTRDIKGKFGKFWGCVEYPKCNGKVNRAA